MTDSELKCYAESMVTVSVKFSWRTLVTESCVWYSATLK